MMEAPTEASVSFSDLKLVPQVLDAVRDAGYTHPTPIQQQAIPLALAGRDLIGLAQTGTGKTAGFTLPVRGQDVVTGCTRRRRQRDDKCNPPSRRERPDRRRK